MPFLPVCALDKETGRCRASMRRYYFDSSSGLCKRFVYGGCGGNGNNFRTIQECRKVCGCRAPVKVGRCRAGIPRYYFNQKTRLCSVFYYGGCDANENNFRTERECLNKCRY